MHSQIQGIHSCRGNANPLALHSGVFNYYPTRTEEEIEDKFVGLGSHTDLQLFTLLWQDSVGGLQILTREGQWIKVRRRGLRKPTRADSIKAPPIEGTLVVNIGDYMMRLCNDIYKSTVHRVTNESTEERVSMPFFFGKCPTFLAIMLIGLIGLRLEFQLCRERRTLMYF